MGILRSFSNRGLKTKLMAVMAVLGVAACGLYGAYPPLGAANTVLTSEFEKMAAARLVAGEPMVEQIDETHLRIAVPLPAQARIGCAECHFATVDRVGEIATSTIEQAGNASEVSKAIHHVTEVTEQTAAGSEEMASSSQELGAQATVLQDLVKRFKTKAVNA